MIEHLRAVAPPPRRCSVEVVRVPDLGDLGYTSKTRAKFLIEIDDALSPLETELILIHEWAHVLDWRPYHPFVRAHGPTWAVLRGEVYCAYYGVL